jgi:hypothetical protein
MTAVTAWSRGKRGSTWKPWSRRAVRISPWLGWLSGYAAHDAVVVESMSSTIRLQEAAAGRLQTRTCCDPSPDLKQLADKYLVIGGF